MIRETRGGRGSALALTLAPIVVLLLAPAAPARAAGDDEALARTLLDALEEGEPDAIAALVDFPRAVDERFAAGRTPRPWDDLDDLDRLLARRRLVEGWLEGQARFLHSAVLRATREEPDPDAGRGPVPDRRVLRLVLENPRLRERRDALAYLTPEGRLLDLVFGTSYPVGAEPAPSEALVPRPRLPDEAVGGDAGVVWPPSVDDLERDAVRELVDELLGTSSDRRRDEIVESLHRSPHAGVAALLERLVEVHDETRASAPAAERLDDALERITGLTGSYREVPGPSQAESTWQARNTAAVREWQSWHAHHGATFQPAPIEDPIHPTSVEGERRPPAAELSGFAAALARAREASPDDEAASGAGTPGAAGVDAGPAASGAAGSGAPSPADARPAPRPIEAAPEPRGPREILFRDAADLSIVFGGREVAARQVEDELAPKTRQLLNEWGPALARVPLDVVVGNRPGHVVAGAVADRRTLLGAATVLDNAHDVIAPLLPRREDPPARAVLAVVLDEDALRGPVFERFLEVLVDRQELLSSQAAAFASDPRGLMLRRTPLLVQPTAALTGDPEFSFDNELAHKFAQCLVTERAGELPAGLRWALGHLVEMRLYGSVWQFNTSGFLSSGEHYDWPVRAEQLVDKRARKRGFSFGRTIWRAAEPQPTINDHMLAWAFVEYLFEHRPELLAGLVERLVELQQEADAFGRARVFVGSEADAVAAIDAVADQIDLDEVVAHLDAM